MNIIELDGKLIKKDGHDYLKEMLNLDALYDCLTEIGIDTEIRLINKDLISKDLLITFIDASNDNNCLKFTY